MNEFVYVEFLVLGSNYLKLLIELTLLGDDYSTIKTDEEYDIETGGGQTRWVRVSGKISSQRATLIKLGNPFLSESMRISTISNSLKNQYRQ